MWQIPKGVFQGSNTNYSSVIMAVFFLINLKEGLKIWNIWGRTAGEKVKVILKVLNIYQHTYSLTISLKKFIQ